MQYEIEIQATKIGHILIEANNKKEATSLAKNVDEKKIEWLIDEPRKIKIEHQNNFSDIQCFK